MTRSPLAGRTPRALQEVPEAVVDVYFVVRTPSGAFLSLTPVGLATGIVPFAVGFTPLAAISAQLLSYTFTGTEPPGVYGIIAGLAQFGTLTEIGSLFEILVTVAL